MKDYIRDTVGFAEDFLAVNPDKQLVGLGRVLVDRAGNVTVHADACPYCTDSALGASMHSNRSHSYGDNRSGEHHE